MIEKKLENELAFQIWADKLPPPEREFKFHPTRRWRCDFAWPNHKLLVEVEGGIWTHGRHVRGKGFQNDCEKYNECVVHGFVVLRVTKDHIRSGKALEWIKKALK